MKDETLDTEAFTLFRAGCSQPAKWEDFTERQKDHWRAVAANARWIHTQPRPTRKEIAAIVLEHWPKDGEDPRYPTSVRCGADGCNWTGRFPGEISEHVADLICGEVA